MTDIRAPYPPSDYFDQRVIGNKKVPIWAIILIVILIILLIIIPIIVWSIARGSGAKGGTGDECQKSSDCANGLACKSGSCGAPTCIHPSKPVDITNLNNLVFPTWDITLNWSVTTQTDFYIVYFGSESGFTPAESIYSKYTINPTLTLEGVSPLQDHYVRIRAFNELCGGGTLSDEYTFTAPAIVI